MAILFATGAFHVYRGVPVDAAIFLSAGAALAVDTAVRNRRYAQRGRRPGQHSLGHDSHSQDSQRQHSLGHDSHRQRSPGQDSPGQHSSRSVSDELRGARAVPRWLWIALTAGVGAISLAVVVLAPDSSSGIPAVVGLVGAAMLLVAWPDPPRLPGRPAPRVRRAAYWWAGVVLFLCIWEMDTYFIDRFSPAEQGVFPPLTDLLQPLFNDDSSRWFMTGLWLVACGALVRVVRRT